LKGHFQSLFTISGDFFNPVKKNISIFRSGIISVLILLVCSAPAQDGNGGKKRKDRPEPIDGWAMKKYHTPAELKEIRKAKWEEMEAWEQEHFKAPRGRWYFGVRGGYTIPYLTIQNRAPVEYLGTSDLFIGDDGDLLNRGIYSANAGGARFGVYAGYMFNQFIGLEADFGFNYYKKIVLGRNNTPSYKSELVTWSRDLSFMPQLVFNTPNIRNFYFYAKVGFFIPYWGGTSGEAYVDDYSGKFLRDLAGQPVSGTFTLIDLLAMELGETVPGLGFLEDGIFQALGYHVRLNTDVEIDLRPDVDALGFTATLGGRLQINEVIGLTTEFRVAGYNISTDKSTLKDLRVEGELLGNPDFLLITNDGATVNGNEVPVEELEFLIVTDYVYELTEESNHPVYNPNGVDPTRPSQQLATRNSANGFTISVGMQFNFGGRKKNDSPKNQAGE
jgi:hypothetical protein